MHTVKLFAGSEQVFDQHLPLSFAQGLGNRHRWNVRRRMAYASALLWFIFLLLNTVEIALQALLPITYFSSEPSLFPTWPQSTKRSIPGADHVLARRKVAR